MRMSRVGLEPTTLSLKGRCSTTELAAHRTKSGAHEGTPLFIIAGSPSQVNQPGSLLDDDLLARVALAHADALGALLDPVPQAEDHVPGRVGDVAGALDPVRLQAQLAAFRNDEGRPALPRAFGLRRPARGSSRAVQLLQGGA